MAHLLHLDSSISGERSASRAITAAFAEAWTGTVTYRDLAADPLPYLADADQHWHPTAFQRQIIDELLAADVVLIGAPMYNYSVSATLKTWIDHVHVPDVTTGGMQPLAGRTAVVATSRGIAYDAGSPTEGWDHNTPVLELILGTAFGMNVEVITASYTLAERVPELAPMLDRSRAELAAAIAAAAIAASRLS